MYRIHERTLTRDSDPDASNVSSTALRGAWADFLKIACVQAYQGRRRRAVLTRACNRAPTLAHLFAPIIPIDRDALPPLSSTSLTVRPATHDELGNLFDELAEEDRVARLLLANTPLREQFTTFYNSPAALFSACMQGRLYVIHVDADAAAPPCHMSGAPHLLPAFAIVSQHVATGRVECQMVWVAARCRRLGLASLLVQRLGVVHVGTALAEAMPFWTHAFPNVTIGKVEHSPSNADLTLEQVVTDFCQRHALKS